MFLTYKVTKMQTAEGRQRRRGDMRRARKEEGRREMRGAGERQNKRKKHQQGLGRRGGKESAIIKEQTCTLGSLIFNCTHTHTNVSSATVTVCVCGLQSHCPKSAVVNEPLMMSHGR